MTGDKKTMRLGCILTPTEKAYMEVLAFREGLSEAALMRRWINLTARSASLTKESVILEKARIDGAKAAVLEEDKKWEVLSETG